MIKHIFYMCICWFYYVSLKIPLVHKYGTYCVHKMITYAIPIKINASLYYVLQITQKIVDPKLVMLYELLQRSLDKSMAMPNHIYTSISKLQAVPMTGKVRTTAPFHYQHISLLENTFCNPSMAVEFNCQLLPRMQAF